jgi:Glyoxalase-like domain
VTLLTLDHLVFATPDLATGVDRISAVLGVVAVAGGQHPGRGTRNALVRIGPRSYLEIVGPDPDQAPPDRPRWFGIDELTEPRLVGWAAASTDVAGARARARHEGVLLGNVGVGRRTRADGVELEWRFTDPTVVVAGGLVPFLIDWGTSPHPALAAPPGATILDLRAEHPDPPLVERHLRVIGVDMQVSPAAVPALVARFRTQSGEVELR